MELFISLKKVVILCSSDSLSLHCSATVEFLFVSQFPRGIPTLGIQGVSWTSGLKWSVFFPISTPFYSFPSLTFILCFTLIVVSSLEMRAFFYKPISSCSYQLLKNCELPAWWPVSLEKGILAAGGNQHYFGACFR